MRRGSRIHLLIACAALFAPVLAGQTFTVTAVDPAPHERLASTAAPIHVTFSAAVDPASLDARSFAVFGRWSGVVPGTFGISADGRTATFAPSRPYFPGEHVSVALSRAVRSLSSQPLAAGFVTRFSARGAASTSLFYRARSFSVRRPGETFLQLYGAYAGDLDRDGSPDLSMPCEVAHDVRVLHNDGCGLFEGLAVNVQVGRTGPSTNEGQDFNADGWTDLAVGNIQDRSVSIFMNDGTGAYLAEVRYPTGTSPRGIAPVDVDGDGDADLVVANRNSSDMSLLRNRGDGTFLPATTFDGGGDGETAVGSADADGDGIADLFVANYTSGTVSLLLGDGLGGFQPSASRPVGGNPWMLDLGDIDGDGHVDVATADSATATATIVRGDGRGGLLAPVSIAVGRFPTAIDVGDVDGDGDLDIVVSCFGSAEFWLLRNSGAGAFASPTVLHGIRAASCSLLVDFDRDGDVDILEIDELEDTVIVFFQADPDQSGVQKASCDATLRVDNMRRSAGFGGRPPHLVGLGADVFIGLSGRPAAPYFLFASTPDPLGIGLPFGLLHLQIPLVPLVGATFDAMGEGHAGFAVPTNLGPGAQVAFQFATLGGDANTLLLSNPELVEVR